MRRMIRIGGPGFFVFLWIVVLACDGVQAQGNLNTAEGACRNSVQTFYNWYVDQRIKENKDWRVALENRSAMFSKVLSQALKGSDAESRVSGDAVLDFDPILATQDMGSRYTVRNATINHDRCLADVYGEWPTPVSGNGPGPNVIAELIHDKGRWMFVNFRYPSSGSTPETDLLKILGTHHTR